METLKHAAHHLNKFYSIQILYMACTPGILKILYPLCIVSTCVMYPRYRPKPPKFARYPGYYGPRYMVLFLELLSSKLKNNCNASTISYNCNLHVSYCTCSFFCIFFLLILISLHLQNDYLTNKQKY